MMPHTEKSLALPAGLITGALYAILLISFLQESYARRDATTLAAASLAWPVVHDVSKRVCRVDARLCALSPDDDKPPSDCVSSLDAVRRLLDEPMVLGNLRAAMRGRPD